MSGDLGLFGPGSVTWRLHSEPILLLGGLRSLYLQALHPRAVTAVAQNSDYRADPWGRLLRTADYVGTVVFGTTADAELAAGRVRRMHSQMSAVDPSTGERFRIDDPDLLRWVHVVEIESFLTTAIRAGVRLSPAEIDGYYDEQRRAAELMGLDPATVPATAADVADYYRAIRPELRLTKDGADAALLLTAPPAPAVPSRALRLGLTFGPPRWAYLGVVATAVGLLPPWARRLYGGLGLPTTDLTADLSARGLRLLIAAVLASLPARYRVTPLRAAAEARAAAAASA
jgi:uncharacterized protein (DUF2236 family)